MKIIRSLAAAMAAAICLCTVFVGVALAQEQVGFPASDPFTARQITLTGVLNKPLGNGPFPAVVLMHGCGGWQPAVRYSLDLLSEYLSEHGYVVLSVDSFGPRNLSGDDMCASNADDAGLSGTVSTISMSRSVAGASTQRHRISGTGSRR